MATLSYVNEAITLLGSNKATTIHAELTTYSSTIGGVQEK